MKKIYSLILMLMLLIPINVVAAGGFNVSTSSITMYVGESKTVTISASNSAGRLDISSSNSGVAGISASSIFLDNDSGSITISANSVGSASISVVASANYATYDEEILGGQTKTITVNVLSIPTPQPDPTPTPTPKPNTNNNLSTNNSLKGISINDYELVKIDNNNYTLSVSNNITNIELKAESEDTKAKISGVGNHELNIGENIIEVIITSESGLENKINIKIIRKEAYYLEDLKLALEENKSDNIQISVDANSKISVEDLNKIKNSKKTVNFNYFDENKKMIYSWSIDGSKIKDVTEFAIEISFDTTNKGDIDKLSNYADGLYLSFKHNGNLPDGTKIKIFVGDKFKDGSTINIYYYNNDSKKLESIANDLVVKYGYVEFSIKHCSDYFVTMSKINSVIKDDSSINVFIIISVIELLVIGGGLLVYIFKIDPRELINKKKKEKEVKEMSFMNGNSQDDNKFSSTINDDNFKIDHSSIHESMHNNNFHNDIHDHNKIHEAEHFGNDRIISPLNHGNQDNNK